VTARSDRSSKTDQVANAIRGSRIEYLIAFITRSTSNAANGRNEKPAPPGKTHAISAAVA
jgi:hypothetical protein